MKNNFKSLPLLCAMLMLVFAVFSSCDGDDATVVDDTDGGDTDDTLVIDVDSSLFLTSTDGVVVSTVPCTLSDGTVTDCFQLVTISDPADREMGPWCPDTITDDAEKGGIWIEGGEVYDVDGAFIANMADFYNDTTWQMYDADGNIYKTLTEEDCRNAANPQVGVEYQNFCVECLPSYVTDISNTYVIPITPVMQSSATTFGGDQGNSAPSHRGVAFNGTVFDAPAPTDDILAAYTIAPFDDAGGHINPNNGYHYHTATGLTTAITQDDGHADMIGYALDGFAMHSQLNDDGNEPTDLDACRGHEDETRGYHYHIDAPGSNNFINCLSGAYAN